MSDNFTVVSFYKFIELSDPKETQAVLLKKCRELNIKGTILLASEGINGMISGSHEDIESIKKVIHSDPRFASIVFKDSFYEKESFRRMLVKVKKYIVTMRKEVDPLEETGHYLHPRDFKNWQDEGKEMLILDTRNDYEFALGTFENAIDPKIKSFDEFPAWVENNLQNEKDKPIVTFCTGGIRCEKATAYMKKVGFKEVYQLDGGVLNYFEETLHDEENYWKGDCVVFDKRKALTKSLEVTKKNICYVCLQEIDINKGSLQEKTEACSYCVEKMQKFHENRLKRGQIKSKKFMEERAKHLKAENEKYSKAYAK